MEFNLKEKVNRLNEFYSRREMGLTLTDLELKEQQILREELLNYFKYACTNRQKNQ